MTLADDSANKKAKEVTPKQEKIKTALNWIMTIVCIVMVVFALVVAIFTIVRSTNGLNLTTFGNKIYMNVMSDSMDPTFSQSDVIITESYKGDGKDLKVGQVVTFCFEINRRQSYNTHRIVYIAYKEDGSVDFIKTRGDNQEGDWKDSLAPAGYTVEKFGTGPDGTWDSSYVTVDNVYNDMKWKARAIVATWGSVDENGEFHDGKMLKGVGAFANWIQDNEHGKTRFFCVIVLPLIILFIAYAFVLVRTLVIAKLENNKKVAGEPVRDVDGMSDEEKRRLAQELLASLGGVAAAGAAQPADDDKTSETPSETEQSAEIGISPDDQPTPEEHSATNEDNIADPSGAPEEEN